MCNLMFQHLTKRGKREREKGKEEMGILRHPVPWLKVAGRVKKEMASA